MATGFDTLGCPFCTAPLHAGDEYVAHVDSCMRLAVSDGRDHETYQQLTSRLDPYSSGQRGFPGGPASSDPTDPPDDEPGGGRFWRRS